MAAIDVDFEVYKALTVRRASESVSYNDVLRGMLGLPPHDHSSSSGNHPKGWAQKGLTLPNGSLLRASYRGQIHTAAIVDGKWIDETGEVRSSPSNAAVAVTGNNVNGWRFWTVMRPGDTRFHRLDALRS